MTSEPLPDSWDDEPWPLDDPIPNRGLRPTNWSDTHADPPQVADLADEAWQRATDRGISMGQALAELQHEAEFRRILLYGSGSGGGLATGGHVKVASIVSVPQSLLDDIRHARQDFEDAWDRVKQMMAAPTPVAKIQEMADKITGDRLLSETKAAPIVPSWQWDACREDRR